jgi:autotransporter-associated beta strand protein
VTNGGAANRTLTTGGDNTSTAFSGVIQDGAAGATNLAKAGTGTFTLSGANTYTGTTTISAGTLQIGNGGTTGTIGTGNIVDNAALVFNRSDTLTVGGTISGSGSLTQAGTGTLTLTGNNTYTGITTISAGTLQIGNGSTSGNIVGDIVNNAALVFNRSNASTYGGVISGTGSVTKIGGGTRTLTGTNTYSGGTTINAGTLAVSSDASLGAASGGLTASAAGRCSRLRPSRRTAT